MTQSPSNPPDPARARLLELSKQRGASLSSLSELLGRNRAYLQQFIRKHSPRKLEEGDRHRLAEFFGVNEAELRSDNVALEDKSYASNAPTSAPSPYVNVPRLPIGASAGPGALPGEEAAFDSFKFSRRWLTEQGLESAHLSFVTVDGDSMEPLLNDGDDILVDRTPRAFRDGIHVVRIDDTLMVKRVASAGAGRFSLLSQNLAYPPVSVDAGEIEIIGRVVWKGGRI